MSPKLLYTGNFIHVSNMPFESEAFTQTIAMCFNPLIYITTLSYRNNFDKLAGLFSINPTATTIKF